MSGDIVERLRVDCECYDGDTCVHAAARDEIVRLRAEAARKHDYACRMDALAEERLMQATRLRAAGDAMAKALDALCHSYCGSDDDADLVDAWQEARRG